MKIRKHNYFGINHTIVNSKFEGGLIYCNDLEIKGITWAVYSVAEPDRAKNHKDFLLLSINGGFGNGIVNGMDKDQILPYRKVNAVHCLNCDEVIYSPQRHYNVSCSCKNVAIDGGNSYNKISTKDSSVEYKFVILDALTDTIIPEELW